MNRRIIAGSMVMATLIFSGCSAVPDGTISWEKQSADGVVIENNHVKIPKLKTMIKIKYHREFTGVIKSCTIWSNRGFILLRG